MAPTANSGSGALFTAGQLLFRSWNKPNNNIRDRGTGADQYRFAQLLRRHRVSVQVKTGGETFRGSDPHVLLTEALQGPGKGWTPKPTANSSEQAHDICFTELLSNTNYKCFRTDSSSVQAGPHTVTVRIVGRPTHGAGSITAMQ